MKKIFTIILLTIVCFSANGQYYSNSQKFVFTHRSLPTFHTYEDERVFFLECEMDDIVKKYTNHAKIASLLQLSPWKETENEDEAFLKISLSIKDFLVDIGAREVVDNIGRRMFTPKGECTMTTSLSIHSELENAFFPTQTYTSGTDVDKLYPEPFLAENFVRDNRDFYERQAVEAQVENIVAQINNYMSEKYLYGFYDDNIRLYFFDSPKNPYYEKHKEAKTAIAQIFSTLSQTQDLLTARKQMEEWSEHFLTVYKALDQNNKKESNAKMQMLWNLGELSYALDYFDLARQYADDLKQQFPNSEADKLIKKIVDAKKFLKEHELTSRYF